MGRLTNTELKVFNGMDQIKILNTEVDYVNCAVFISFTDKSGDDSVCMLTVFPSVDKRAGEWSMYGVRSVFEESNKVHISETLKARLKFVGRAILEQLMFEMDQVGNS